jgi:hypothetical protein
MNRVRATCAAARQMSENKVWKVAANMEQIRTQLEQELFKLSDEGWSYVLAEVGEQPTAADIKRFVLEVRAPSHSILTEY